MRRNEHTAYMYVIVIDQFPRFECFYIAYKVRDWSITIFSLSRHHVHNLTKPTHFSLLPDSCVHVVDAHQQAVVHDAKALENFTVSIHCSHQGIVLLMSQHHTLKEGEGSEA